MRYLAPKELHLLFGIQTDIANDYCGSAKEGLLMLIAELEASERYSESERAQLVTLAKEAREALSMTNTNKFKAISAIEVAFNAIWKSVGNK